MLVVDFEQLSAAVAHMERFGREVSECLEGIEQTMATLRASWHGEGSDAQAQAEQQWEDGAEQMRSALAQLKTIAETAHKNYTNAVDQNGKMWPA